MILASVSTTAAIIGYYQLISQVDDERSRVEIVRRNVVIVAVALALLTAAVSRWMRRKLEPEWVAAAPQVLDHPRRVARFVVMLWLVAAVVSPLDDALETHYKAAAAEFVGVFLGSLANAALVYLLAERALRPVFATAFAAGTADSVDTPGVRYRFLVAWALGSGIPLAGIAATPFIRTGELPPVVGMAYLAVLGLVVGAFLTWATARSVAEPLDTIVGALRRVERGELDVSVERDDAGDVGRLQAGVNQMVAALRERLRIEDLFGRHVGVEAARAALQQGVTLSGDRREASVLFVDLIGSTVTTSAVDPAEVVATANRLFAEVVRTVTACGGWVNKFQGDGAMCVFGAPARDARHREHALDAAVQLRRRLTEDGLEAAIGVADGEVIAGHVGTEERLEYTVMGATVNKAARLCELAKSHEQRVLATAGPSLASGVPHGWADAGEVSLRGFPDPVATLTIA